MVTYSKGIQTASITPPDSGDEGQQRQTADAGRETEDEMRHRILEEMEKERTALEHELQELRQMSDAKSLPGQLDDERIQIPANRTDLSNEQRQAIFAAPDFSHFIEESSKIVQRALSDGYDYIRDYTVGLDGAS